MNVHEQFADDLSLYALGALQGEERLTVEKHLEECSACRRELEQLRGDLALLALSASGPRPPSRSRERLMAAIAKEPRRAVQPRLPARRAWWNGLEWAAAVAGVVIVVLLMHQNTDLRRRVVDLEMNSSKQDQQLREANELLATLTSPDAAHFTLVAGKTPPQPQGKAIYVRGSGTLVFLASNMPPIPQEKIYELWLIPTSGAPIPAGLFKPNARGAAAVIKPSLPAGVEAKTFAITIEPETGSSAPTSQPIMVGIGG
jgi:anti-sigma-K factor RskA